MATWGYIYFQPQTNWHSSPGFTFDQTVNEIITMRLKNPRFANQWSTDVKEVSDELDYFTCLRIKNNPQYCLPETIPAHLDLKKKSSSLRGWKYPFKQSGEKLAVAAGRAENVAAGVGVVLDWLGDSLEPVAPELAEKRAGVCIQCPKNGDPDLIQRLLSIPASGVKELIEFKTGMELKTSYDDKLHNCSACDCVLTLKVWAPMAHIKKHTSDKVKADLHPICWMLKEWDT